jgi:pilus assembly protein CpaB
VKKPNIIAIVLVLGAMAAFFVAQLTSAPDGKSRVVIVEQPIEAGKAIKTDQVKAIAWPGSAIPHDAFNRTTDVMGRIARVSMIQGEPVLPGKLAPKGSTGGLSSLIPEGKRAITVKVNEVIAVAGFALPGSYVDVLVSGKDAEKQPFSRTVLSRVKVLAAAQKTSSEPDKPKVVNAVTLELTTRESEELDLARNIGKLSLVLRNELDTGKINSAGVRLPDIVNSPSTQITTPPEKPAPSLHSPGPEEIRGTRRQSVTTP